MAHAGALLTVREVCLPSSLAALGLLLVAGCRRRAVG